MKIKVRDQSRNCVKMYERKCSFLLINITARECDTSKLFAYFTQSCFIV